MGKKSTGFAPIATRLALRPSNFWSPTISTFFPALLALLGTAFATLGRSRALLAGYVQALQVRYQGAPKARRNYVEMVGLQKLLGLSASLVAIVANPLDFFLAASPSSHHPHRPPGTVNLWVLFPRTYFFLPDTFSGKRFPTCLRTPPLKPLGGCFRPCTYRTHQVIRIALEGTRLAKIRLEQGGDAHIQASTAFSAAQATWRSRRPLTERPASRRQESNEWQPRRLPCPNDRLDPRGHPKTSWHHAQQARSPSAVPWWFEMLTWGMRRR